NPGGVSIGTTPTINATESGDYTLVVTDAANGCTAQAQATVGLDENVPVIDLPLPAQLTCSTDEVSLDASGSTGTGNLNYSWRDGGNNVLGASALLTVNNPGNYTLVITDPANGCTAEATVAVNQDIAAPNPVAAADGILTCSNNNVALSGMGSVGIGTLTYTWWDSNNNQIASGLSTNVSDPGTYTLIITDSANGCTSSTPVTVAEDEDLPTPVAIAAGQLTCNTQMVQLDGTSSSGTGNLTYSWLAPNNNPISSDDRVEVGTPGTYTLVVTDVDNGCSATSTVEVIQDIISPTADAGNGGVLSCDVSFVNLDGSNSSNGPNIDYEWFNPANVSVGLAANIDVTEAGTYTLVVTNTTNGCTQSAEVTVTPDVNLPVAEVLTPAGLTCVTTSVDLDAGGSTANGPLAFAWIDENNNNVGSTSSIAVMTPGNYTVIITDQNNGCTAESTVEVVQDITAPDVAAVAQGELTCTNLNTTLEAQTSTTLDYNWLDANNNSIGAQANVVVTTTGVYTLVVTDPQTGCTNSTQVEVFDNIAAPLPNATVSAVLNCVTDNVDLSANGSSGIGVLTYRWLNEGGVEVGTDLDLVVNNAGIYELIITDAANGCTASTTVEVLDDFAAPTADAGTDDVLTCDIPEVTLNGNASSGGNNISYQWLNEQNVEVGTDVNLAVSQPGDYSLIVTNTINGCTAIDQVTVSPDVNLPTPEANVANVINCNNASTLIDGSNSTGTGNLSYEWQDELGAVIGTDPSVEVSTAGNYLLIITDELNGCTAEMSALVEENFVDPQAMTGPDALLTCQVTEVMVSGMGSSTGNEFAYQWLNPSNVEVGTDLDLSVTEVGIYTLVVTNTINGCSASATVEVQPDVGIPTPAINQSGILTCSTGSVLLDGSGSVGAGGLNYLWLDASQNTVETADQVEVSTPGIYTLIITANNNGCSAEMTVEVLEDVQTPVADAGPQGLLTCAAPNWQLDASASSTGAEFAYQWLDASNQEISTALDPVVTTPGIYTLMVTNTVNGCTETAEVLIEENVQAPQPVVAMPALITCASPEIVLDATASLGIDPLLYEWQDANGMSLGNANTLMVNNTGTYTLLITDPANGCTATTQTTVSEDVQAPIADSGSGGTLTCDALSVTLDGNASSSGANFSYEWFNAGNVSVGTSALVNVAEVGTYTLVVTNTNNGCTAQASAEVTPDANLPTAVAAVDATLTCVVPTANLDGSGSSSGIGITYAWFDPASALIANETNVEVNQPGTYTLVVTDTNNGCTASFSVEVDQDIIAPQADAGADAVLTCQIPTVNLDGSNSTGALLYQWINPAGISIGSTPNLEVANPGTYELIVTAANGCTNSATVEVSLDADVPVADPGEGGLLTCDQQIISLGGSGTSTGNSITYEWLDENNNLVGNTLSVDVSTPGIYTLVVSNATNACSSSSVVEVQQDILAPVADPGVENTLDCALAEWTLGGVGTTNGPGITYQWQASNGSVLGVDPELTVSTPDVYTLLVTNTNNGCTAESSIEVFQNLDTPVADAGPGSVLTCVATTALLNGSNSSQG
ncbi:MAG: hypothetical protein AAGD05_03060, partial [Bacteroidota bacterium]